MKRRRRIGVSQSILAAHKRNLMSASVFKHDANASANEQHIAELKDSIRRGSLVFITGTGASLQVVKVLGAKKPNLSM